MDDQLVFAAGPNGSPLWVTTTGGGRWRQIGALQQTTAVAFAPDVEGWCWSVTSRAPSTSPRIAARRGPTLSFDAGQGGAIRSIAISPEFSKDHTFFVGTESAGVYRTTDGGSSFTPVDDGLSDRKTMSLALSPSFATDGTLWVSTYTDGVYESSDRGKSWSARLDGLTTDEQADLLHTQPVRQPARRRGPRRDHATLFLCGFNGLFVTDDGGRAWSE